MKMIEDAKYISICPVAVETWAVYQHKNEMSCSRVHLVALNSESYAEFLEPDSGGTFECPERMANFVGYCYVSKPTSVEMQEMRKK